MTGLMLLLLRPRAKVFLLSIIRKIATTLTETAWLLNLLKL